MAASSSNRPPAHLQIVRGPQPLSLAEGFARRSVLTIEIPSDPHRSTQDTALESFVRSSGGSWGRIVVIPLATPDPQGYGRSFAQCLIEHGAGMISVLQLTERRHAEDVNATDLIETATGILLAAGTQTSLTTLLEGTALLQRIRQRNQAGVVVAVTDAAAALFAIPLGPPVERMGNASRFRAY